MAPWGPVSLAALLVLCLLLRHCHRRRGGRTRLVRMPGHDAAACRVYTVTNRMWRPEVQLLAYSVARAGGRLHVLYAPDEAIGRMPVGYNAKVLALYAALGSAEPGELFCFVDAFDVLFVAPLAELLAGYGRLVPHRDRLLFSAEPWCGPVDPPYDAYCPAYGAADLPPAGRYRYLNSGCYIGPGVALRDAVRPHLAALTGGPIDDQAFFGSLYLANEGGILLDHGCRCFQNLIGHTQDGDFEWVPGARRWRNRHTGSLPVVLHGNGPPASRALLFAWMGPTALV